MTLELPDVPRWIEAHGIAADAASWPMSPAEESEAASETPAAKPKARMVFMTVAFSMGHASECAPGRRVGPINLPWL